MKKQIFAVLLALASVLAHAQEAIPPSLRFFGNFGNGSSYEVNASTGIHLHA